MKGLELCEKYFRQIGLPVLESECRELLPKMAIGLVGDGSDCFGYDDEISRDHDWGPGFCIWLDSDDFHSYGQKVQSIYDTLQKSFMGFEARYTSQYGSGRVGVLEIDSFYQRYLGSKDRPQTLREWLVIPENAMATAVNGRVFHDPAEKFTAIRKTLINDYPDDVRIKKIAARCMSAGQAGQYNYPRCVQRNDIYAASQSEMKFLESALSLIFLLNRRYLPFYKWAHHAVKELPVLGSYTYDSILELMQTRELGKKEEIIETLALKIIGQFKELGLSDSKSDFLPDHGPVVQSHIKDQQVRGYSVLAG
jgi:hypothetical protein